MPAQPRLYEGILAQALEQNSASIIITDLQGNIEYVNPTFTAVTGYGAGEVIGRNASLLQSGETEQAAYQEMWRTISSGAAWRGELHNRRKNGELYWEAVAINPVRDASGAITHFVAVQEDITGRKLAEQELQLGMYILNCVSEGIAVTDKDGNFQFVNPAFAAITGYSPTEVLGENSRVLSSGLMDEVFYRKMWDSLKTTGRWQGEIIDRRKNGESYPEWLSISTVRDLDGEISHYVSVFSDISERKAAELKLTHMAQHDFLTGLPNRMLMLDRMSQTFAHAGREGSKVAVMFLDLDRFKTINDTFGHVIGDKLLQEVARRINRISRAGDTVCRVGGDEFVVMLPGLDSVEAISAIAAKLLHSVSGPCVLDGHEIEITTSLGISVFPDDGSEGEDLLRHADAAMYHAKQGDRNSYRFFTAEMNRRALERMRIETKLRHAMERGEFQLYYQPQVDRISGRITGAEALLRWNDPETGLIDPIRFIPVAEETGMIIPIGEWVLREACRQNAAWRAAGLPEIVVSVNLSVIQFRQRQLTRVIQEALGDSGLAAAGLELEITESAVMNDADEAIMLLYEIRNLGVKLAMDDFGTGYSSLIYLKRLPIDKLKIDQSFVRHMADDSDDAVIVSSIISLARNLGLKHVAEGVETQEQLEILSIYGCDEMQGFYFGNPMPAGEFADYLRTHLRS